ncbi:zinc metalloprotease [Pyrococcus yayanosii]|uniref:Zinc metallopeptidase n=1 Tax=Pyrococcus yayanosii (strain CH1 / JCM 16557) TaxID=529709 RepID=F8AFT7_PYRYC|nr:peptidase [Pyrococcus yayanosii]AEH23838.1 Zinc metallopeptidase [Pyrococcus yayanosii CH1]
MDRIAFAYMGGEEFSDVFFEVYDRVRRYFRDVGLAIVPIYVGRIPLPPGTLARVETSEGYVKMYSFEAVVEALYGKLVEMKESVHDESLTKIFGLTTYPVGSRDPHLDFYKKYLGLQVTVANYHVMVLSMKPFQSENRFLFVERVFKGVLHEIGHLYGLDHCRNRCVMNPPSDVQEWDSRPPTYCNSCLKKLRDREELKPMPRFPL